MQLKCQVPPVLALLLCTTVGASPSNPDARIEAAARSSYTFKVLLKGDAVTVRAEDGIVTLSGTTANGYRRALAEETVTDLPSVKSVVNLITVKGEQPAEGSDAWLALKVRTALIYHRNVDAAATEVAARDGIVTLTGTAASQAQKELTGEVVRSLEGVKAVLNNLEVVGKPPRKTLAEKIDDASITAQVKASLLFHRSTSMLATKVKTDRGVVRIQGKAKNAAEKDLVTHLVAGLKGVKRVENRMVVESPS